MNKEKRITIRLTEKQFNFIKENQKNTNTNKEVRRIIEFYAKYIKNGETERKIQIRKDATLKMLEITGAIEKGNSKIEWLLSNIAKNINQIARIANTEKTLTSQELAKLFLTKSKADEITTKMGKLLHSLIKEINQFLKNQKLVLDNDN